ncbi:uncharacterized protein LOC118419722 [Branchiostoma floridae]|uniref:Uncharacterized protein LOC118419722 n=1 Tax=Branchiostoma floridae TaxID=7739 RepID=A0A9J7MX68_BRAFL|nr:uncharacterized protein LOC118419722 [Branchiostoma floridae]
MARLLKVRCRETFLKGGPPTIWQARLSDLAPVTGRTYHTFDTNAGESVPDPLTFIRQNGAQFTVYSVDFDQRLLGMVKVTEGIDILKAPFLYQAQREHAEELLLVPFDVLPAVADAMTETLSGVKNVFLHNTGRCGSTLMCKAMGVIDQVLAVSEPDIFTVTFERACARDVPLTPHEEEEVITVLRCSVILLNFYLHQNHSAKALICYKLRSESIFIADLIQKAVPESKTIFMYRDLPNFYDSTLHVDFGGSYWRYFFQTVTRYDVLFRVPTIKDHHPYFRFAAEHPRMVSCPVQHGIPFINVSLWILQMQKAFDLIQEDTGNFFHASLTFKHLLEHKERIVVKVLENIGVHVSPDTDSSRVRGVFGVDSQKGNFMEGKRGRGAVRSSWVGSWDNSLFSTVLAHFNGDVDEPDFILPNTTMIADSF